MENHEFKSKGGFKRIVNAAHYSRDGLQAAYQHEAAFRQLLLLHGTLLVLLFFVDFDLFIKMLLLMASVFSLIVELLNSGIEAVVDDISLEHRPLAKRAKDVGSAAQMLALFLIAILWLMAIYHH